MAIYERVTGTGDPDTEPKLDTHAFVHALRLWMMGDLSSQAVINEFDLSASDIADGAAIKTAHDALATEQLKSNFRSRIESVLELAERHHDTMTKAVAKNILGF